MANTLAARRAGITALTQIQTLELLGTTGPRTLSEIARALGVSTAAITGLADRFEKLGLATRTSYAGDRRKHLLELTHKGIAVANDIATPEPEPEPEPEPATP